MKTWGSAVDIQKFKAALGDPSGSQQELDEDPKNVSKEELDKNHSNESSEKSDEYIEDHDERHDLLDRYGLKEIDLGDVDELLGSYDSASLDNKELENMERVLSKKIYQTLTSITLIKKAAVEVYLYNSDELYGTVNVIVEYEPKGFLDRIFGTSNNKMDAEIIEIVQEEISEVFESHPEIVENFEIKVESF